MRIMVVVIAAAADDDDDSDNDSLNAVESVPTENLEECQALKALSRSDLFSWPPGFLCP